MIANHKYNFTTTVITTSPGYCITSVTGPHLLHLVVSADKRVVVAMPLHRRIHDLVECSHDCSFGHDLGHLEFDRLIN